jgi:cytoskeletal protein RodZ
MVEMDIGRIAVQDQPGQKVHETPSQPAKRKKKKKRKSWAWWYILIFSALVGGSWSRQARQIMGIST